MTAREATAAAERPRQLLTIEEAAGALDVSRAWLFSVVLRSGQLPVRILGPRCHRIAVRDLATWLQDAVQRTVAASGHEMRMTAIKRTRAGPMRDANAIDWCIPDRVNSDVVPPKATDQGARSSAVVCALGFARRLVHSECRPGLTPGPALPGSVDTKRSGGRVR